MREVNETATGYTCIRMTSFSLVICWHTYYVLFWNFYQALIALWLLSGTGKLCGIEYFKLVFLKYVNVPT